MSVSVPRPPPGLLLAGLCIVAALADAVFLLAGAPPLAATLPLGVLPGGVVLALDGLSGFVLLIALLAGAAASAAAFDWGWARIAGLGVCVAGMALCLAAGDGVLLLAGFELMAAAAWVLLLTEAAESDRPALVRYAGIAAFGALCLIAAIGLLVASGVSDGLSFVAMRAAPPQGALAGAVFALTLLGAGAMAGLAPLHAWLPPAHAAAPPPVAALLSGAMTKVALYVLIRVLLDLCGPVQPAAWGAVLMLVGAAGAVLGAARANVETDLQSVLGCATVAASGSIAAGLGVALLARAADLPALASLALGAALLLALAHGLFQPLLALAAGGVRLAAGSRQLDRLGGLIRTMPTTTACVLVAAASLAALPPSAGFAGNWLLLQAVFAAPRVGGLAWQMVACVTAAALAFAAALAAAAAIRLVGVGFLGRPRAPRGASGGEAPRPLRFVLMALAGLVGLLGLLPSAGLALAGPALHRLLGDDPAGRAGALAIRTQPDGAQYWPLAVALLLALGAALILGLARWRAPGASRRVPAWDGGYGAPPGWLPFGDPASQSSAAGQSQILRRTMGAVLLRAREQASPGAMGWTAADPTEAALLRPLAQARERLSDWADRLLLLTARRAVRVLFAVLAALLAVVAALGSP